MLRWAQVPEVLALTFCTQVESKGRNARRPLHHVGGFCILGSSPLSRVAQSPPAPLRTVSSEALSSGPAPGLCLSPTSPWPEFWRESEDGAGLAEVSKARAHLGDQSLGFPERGHFGSLPAGCHVGKGGLGSAQVSDTLLQPKCGKVEGQQGLASSADGSHCLETLRDRGLGAGLRSAG